MECLKDFGICDRRCPEYKCEVLHEFNRSRNVTALAYAKSKGTKIAGIKVIILEAFDRSEEEARRLMQDYLTTRQQSKMQKFFEEYEVYRKGFEDGIEKATKFMAR